ncbi:hypothetical protein JXA02_14895 [candidate division KSB1 bacterium]|nr:hypothetical protein [candidate division KSB1 bacterium]
MDAFNKIVTVLFDGLLFPLRPLSAPWALLVLAMLAGLFMLWIFKKVSNQEAIRATKNRIKAHLLEIRLYRHDAMLSLNATGRLFFENGRYFLHLVKPLLLLSAPMLIILLQVGARYGHQPAAVDQPILVSLQLAETIDADQVVLVAQTIQIETAPLFIPQEHAIYWRIRPVRAGASTLTFQYRDETVEKKLVSGSKTNSPLATKRVCARSLAAFLHPAEATLAANSFAREILVDYEESFIRLGGHRIHWLLIFIVISVLSGFLAKVLFKVQL